MVKRQILLVILHKSSSTFSLYYDYFYYFIQYICAFSNCGLFCTFEGCLFFVVVDYAYCTSNIKLLCFNRYRIIWCENHACGMCDMWWPLCPIRGYIGYPMWPYIPFYMHHSVDWKVRIAIFVWYIYIIYNFFIHTEFPFERITSTVLV